MDIVDLKISFSGWGVAYALFGPSCTYSWTGTCGGSCVLVGLFSRLVAVLARADEGVP